MNQIDGAVRLAHGVWLDSPEFKEYTTSDASNSKPKVIKRIEYVRDRLLS